MANGWRVEVTSSDLDLVEELETLPTGLNGSTYAPERILGAVGTLAQIVADLNNLDLNVAGGLIAAWLWQAHERTKANTPPSLPPRNHVRVELYARRADGTEIDISVDADTRDGVEKIVTTALTHAHLDR